MADTNGAEHPRHFRSGLLYGLAAYTLWGLMPLYFRVVRNVPPQEILAHRIFWCGLLLAILITLTGRWPDVARCLRSRRTAATLLLCSLLLAVNWFAYIYAAVNELVTQASLGYFLLPLCNVFFGLLVFRERLRPAQWLSFALAAGGVVYYVVQAGELPWIAVTIALSFTVYGVLRKLTPVDGLVGLFVEILWLSPVATGFVFLWLTRGDGTFMNGKDQMEGFLMLSGVVTAVPLLCFGQAARMLPLSTMGFMQYWSPTLQLLLAIRLYGEPFHIDLQICFACIWTALAIVTADSLIRGARARHVEMLVTDE